MKALKIIGIVVGVLVAAILIVPLFSPSPAQVSSEIEIALEPSQVFPSVTSFENREAWDPWVSSDSTTVVTIESKPGFVGSTYAWDGELVSTGKMEVISVRENEYIASHLWFGQVETPSVVEWTFEAVEGGTQAVWSFSQETTYPFGRLGMMFGKVFLQQSFDAGLASLKALLEENPPQAGPLGPISIEVQQPFEAMVARGAGTMETIGEQLGELYPMVWEELEKQELQLAGPGFVEYLDYDEATGHSNFLAGFIVDKAGVESGKVLAKSYPEMKVTQAIHTGPYHEFYISYGLMEEYIRENGIEVTGEAFEFYTVNMQNEPDQAKWQTIIAFPLK
jgi:effector-binding domain-containing protein/uncharacterized protein YndB with AHSA1/START domain